MRRQVFRRGEIRRGKADFKLIASLEQDANGRFHYHLLIDLPTFRHKVRFAGNLWFTWPRTQWGYKEFKVKPVTDVVGWIRYLTKKENGGIGCGIDWENTRF